MKNFPSFINAQSSQEEVRNYLKSISQSNRSKKPQFHAVISTKYQEHSKEQLTAIADEFMKNMGYESQPYIVVFHKDTENNHVHIVSSRVDKETGKKINDSFEKLKSQQALTLAIEKVLGVNRIAKLDKLLQYRFSNLQQLDKLLERHGFKLSQSEQNSNQLQILHNGVVQKTLLADQLPMQDTPKADKRVQQIKSFIEKYQQMYSNKVFKVVDDRAEKGLYPKEHQGVPKIEFTSELQEKLKNIFGIDIIFHYKDDKLPFGYTLIDNKTQQVYKGSEIMKLKEAFELTNSNIDKKSFERLKDYNLSSYKEKQILSQHLNKKGVQVEPFMFFENKRLKNNKSDFQQIKADVIQHLKALKNDSFVVLEKDKNGDYYAIHQRFHQIHSLQSLIGSEAYQNFISQQEKSTDKAKVITINDNTSGTGSDTDINHRESVNVSEVLKVALKSTENALKTLLSSGAPVGRDNTENELKKRRKKK
jgi:putative mobilization protein